MYFVSYFDKNRKELCVFYNNLALGENLLKNVKIVKHYVHSIIASILKHGNGAGPINRMACLDFKK